MNIKISDFGLSNIISPGKKFTTFCGSLHYACPEILRGEEYVGPGADIWSLGVILYCLVTGSQPWSASTSEEILDQILTKGLVIPSWVSDDCADLIVRMLRLKEKDRITIEEMKKHPWIMKDYTTIPDSHLPSYDGVKELDEDILKQLASIGFNINEKARSAILNGKKTQIVSTYHLLLRRKNEEKQKLELAKKEKKKKAEEGRLRSGTVVEEGEKKQEKRERSGSEPPKVFTKTIFRTTLENNLEEETTSTVQIKKITKIRSSSKSSKKSKEEEKVSNKRLSADSKLKHLSDDTIIKEKKKKEVCKIQESNTSKKISKNGSKRKSPMSKKLTLKEEKAEC